MLMLESSIGAIDVDVVERAMAVRNWSESAARCAVELCDSQVGLMFWEWREHFMAILYTYSMSPEKIELMRSRIVWGMELLERSAVVEGARMSMSRWNSSHQKGVESMECV